jgi:hypothetical protein
MDLLSDMTPHHLTFTFGRQRGGVRSEALFLSSGGSNDVTSREQKTELWNFARLKAFGISQR